MPRRLFCTFVLAFASLNLVELRAINLEWSKLVRMGRDERLECVPYTGEGDRLPDFSYAGYGAGLKEIPAVVTTLTLEPIRGDNHARIQAALDRLAEQPPDAQGWRGALLLRRGRYDIGETLRIRASGIVLRGEGDDPAGTVLVATKKQQHDLIVAGGNGQWVGVDSTATEIADQYVPVGAQTFTVEHPERLRIGDPVIVRRASNAAWIRAIGMDHIPPRPDGKPIDQWEPGAMDLMFDRVILAIEGKRITVDAPLTDGFRWKFGGGRVYRYSFPARLRQVGIEQLRLESGFDRTLCGDQTEGEAKLHNEFFDEAHGWNAITFTTIEEAWARNVTSVFFGNACVFTDRTAK